jgi:hypothetical protein
MAEDKSQWREQDGKQWNAHVNSNEPSGSVKHWKFFVYLSTF